MPTITEIEVDYSNVTPEGGGDSQYEPGEPWITVHDISGDIWDMEPPAMVAATFIDKRGYMDSDGDTFRQEPYTRDYARDHFIEISFHLDGFSRGEIDNIARILDEMRWAREVAFQEYLSRSRR